MTQKPLLGSTQGVMVQGCAVLTLSSHSTLPTQSKAPLSGTNHPQFPLSLQSLATTNFFLYLKICLL